MRRHHRMRGIHSMRLQLYLRDHQRDQFGAYRRLATVTINGEVPAFKLTGWSNEFVTLMLTHALCVSSGPSVLYDWEGTPSNPVQIQIPQQNASPCPERSPGGIGIRGELRETNTSTGENPTTVGSPVDI